MLQLVLIHGDEIDRPQHQWREPCLARNGSQNIAGEGKQQARAFNEENRLEMFVRDVDGKHPRILELHDEDKIVTCRATDLKLKRYLYIATF